MVDPGSFWLGFSVGAIVLVAAAWRPVKRGLAAEARLERKCNEELDAIVRLRTDNEKLKAVAANAEARAMAHRAHAISQRLELAKLNRAIRRRNAALSRRRGLMRDAVRCQSVAKNAEPTEDGTGKLATAVGRVLSWVLEPALDRSDGFPTRFFFGLYSRDGCGRTGVVANGDLTIGELRSALMSVAEEINESVEEDRYVISEGGGSKQEGTPANDAAGPRAAGSPTVGDSSQSRQPPEGDGWCEPNVAAARGRSLLIGGCDGE